MLGPFAEGTLVVGDWQDVMQKLPDQCIDMVLTDPPYGTLLKWKGMGTTTRMGLGRKGSASYDPAKFFSVIPNGDLPLLVREIYRVLKPCTHAYIMCDFETLRLLYNFAIGERVFAPVGYGGRFDACKLLVWDKVVMGTGYTYRQQYEFILMLWKGPRKRQLNDLSIPDILRVKRVAGRDKVVPTQKPVELFALLIRQSTQPGELVFDPFMGSGTTALAADRQGRAFFGCDINPAYVDAATRRIEVDRQMRAQLGLGM